jgi:dihydrofolate reductase
MIRLIAAIDSERGMADDNGIPWILPTDKAYFREHTTNGTVLMGYRTYQEFDQPLSNRRNFVAVMPGTEPLRPGFEPAEDISKLLGSSEDIWVIGGAKLFEQTIAKAGELYLTEIEAKFHCTKFFPEFSESFEPIQKGEPIHENGVTFRFNIYRRKT